MKVVIVQQLLAQYRVPFYEQLKPDLGRSDIDLALVHGRATGARAARNDESSLEWAHIVENRSLHVGQREIAVWQPVLRHLANADLVIVEHANRLLLNYYLMRRRNKLAFWGHGANLQSKHRDGPAERLKRWSAVRADWWFAYTGGSAARVASAGFPVSKITVVNNSVDTSIFREVSTEKVPFSGVYVGALDRIKRIDVLIDAAEIIHDVMPRFTLTVIGDGPLRSTLEAAARSHRWLHYIGPQYGAQKAKLMSRAEILLNPGMVGLVAVDSFAARTPIVTLDAKNHSPEREYLLEGYNCVIGPRAASSAEYARMVMRTLRDRTGLDRLRQGCVESEAKYSLDGMVRAFGDGIRAALET